MPKRLLPPKGERAGVAGIGASVVLSVAKAAGLLTWSWLAVAAPALAVVILAVVALVLAALLHKPKRRPELSLR